jgi:lipopolysaccharide transport system ATP-binding protein
MTAIAINVEGLAKRYRLGEREGDSGLRHVLTRAIHAPWKIFQRQPREMFWALKNVSLQVPHGEVLGLIGRNGAGKTTLLKILSQITRPTAGYAEIYGRVGSLLEVGTGFHPELTGRENLYLSGAILGMTRREINKKFDEIVAFSELEKFLDMPVKHYSSGMYIRLAFAVAAHLEPEILLVDEVLAVGDIKFQKKCLGKMGDVARTGRTVVLVSHQMNQIRRLCQRVVWMDDGKIRQDGPMHDVLAAYESEMLGSERNPEARRGPNPGARFLRWQITPSEPDRGHVLSTLGPFTVHFTVELTRPVRRGQHGVALFNSERQLMWARAVELLQLDAGTHVLKFLFPTLPLKPGAYQWQVSLWDDGHMLDLWDCVPDMVIATEVHQHHMDVWNGILNVPTEFDHGLSEEKALESAPRI